MQSEPAVTLDMAPDYYRCADIDLHSIIILVRDQLQSSACNVCIHTRELRNCKEAFSSGHAAYELMD